MRHHNRFIAFCLVSTLVLELGSALLGTSLSGAPTTAWGQSNPAAGSPSTQSTTSGAASQGAASQGAASQGAASSRRTVVVNSFVAQPPKTDATGSETAPTSAPQQNDSAALPSSRNNAIVLPPGQVPAENAAATPVQNPLAPTISADVSPQRPVSDLATSSRRVRLPFRANPFVDQQLTAPLQPAPLNPVADSSNPIANTTTGPTASSAGEAGLMQPKLVGLLPLEPSLTVNPMTVNPLTTEPTPPALGEPVITQTLPPIVSPSNRMVAEQTSENTATNDAWQNPLLPVAPIVSGKSVSTAVTPLPPIVAGNSQGDGSLKAIESAVGESSAMVPIRSRGSNESVTSEIASTESVPMATSSSDSSPVVMSPLPSILVSPANTSRRRKLIDLNDFLVEPNQATMESEAMQMADLPSAVDSSRQLVDLDQYLVEPAPAVAATPAQPAAARTLTIPKSTGPVPVTVRRESRPRPILRTQDQSDDFQQRRENYLNELKRGMSPVPLRAAMDYDVTTVAPDDSFNYLLHFDGFAVLPVHGYGVRSNSFGQLWDGKLSNWQSPNIRYQPLYFEQTNLERYGVESRFPVVHSGVHFFTSAVMLPYQMGESHPCDPVYPIGLDRPGNCTTPYGYRPTLNPRGLSFQSLLTVGAAFAL